MYSRRSSPLGSDNRHAQIAYWFATSYHRSAFRTKFTSIFTDPLNVYSAAAYDCANILIQAIKTALANGAHTPANSGDLAGAKLFRQAVINAIQNTSYDGVIGHQSFDSNGDTTNKVISIYQMALVSNKPDWKYLTAVTIP